MLLGVTYLDHNENFLAQRQWVGAISAFSDSEGIRARLRDAPCDTGPTRIGWIQRSAAVMVGAVVNGLIPSFG